jgi:hypothetical protein
MAFSGYTSLNESGEILSIDSPTSGGRNGDYHPGAAGRP